MGYLFGQKRRKVGPKRELSLARSHEIDRLSAWDQFRLRFHDLRNSQRFKDPRDLNPAAAAL